MYGAAKSLAIVMQLISNTTNRYCVYGDKNVPLAAFEVESYYKFQREIRERGAKLQYITEITSENVQHCKRMIDELGVELRHQVGIKGFFVVTDGKECVANTGVGQKHPITDAIYSNSPSVVEQNQRLFDKIWDTSIPAEQRISEIEFGVKPESVEILSDRDTIREKFLQLAESTRMRFDSLVDQLVPPTMVQSKELIAILNECKKRGTRMRLITEVTKDNVGACKRVVEELGFELRHLPNSAHKLIVTEDKYAADISPHKPGLRATRLVYSSARELVVQNQFFFESLWKMAIPFEQKVKEIEQGIEAPVIEILSSPDTTKAKCHDLINSSTEELLVAFPSVHTFNRAERAGVVDALEQAAARGVNVKVLSPCDAEISKRIEAKPDWQIFSYKNVTREDNHTRSTNGILLREVDPLRSDAQVSILVSDRKKSLVIEQKDDSKYEFEKAIGLATYSNSKSTVYSYISFFEKLLYEIEIRHSETIARKELVQALAREEKLSKEAQLLQDILAHDIRNYNQVIELGVELLASELSTTDKKMNPAIESVKNAISGSTALLDRAKKLGRVLSDQNVQLNSSSLMKSIENSMSLVRKAYSIKKRVIDATVIYLPQELEESDILVLVDDLLDDVFTNLYANAVKYTNGTEVHIQTTIQEAGNDDYWMISISDNGRGIPDEMKPQLFSRYLKSAQGSGLGMSIVHALVVDRYHGKIRVGDTVRADYTKGTTVEIWLPKA